MGAAIFNIKISSFHIGARNHQKNITPAQQKHQDNSYAIFIDNNHCIY